ncbi:MAG: polysaccharide export protein [bacterium]|nr:polysaccharide export protein [bacterium]
MKFSAIALIRSGLLLIIGLSFLSCAGSHQTALEETARIPLPVFKPPQSSDLPDYIIDFNDLLEIKFFNNERFNETVRVRPDGRITLLRIGDLLVVGRTPHQVDSLITVDYENIIKDPDVTVFVREFGAPEVYVMGEVARPGAVAYKARLTATQAVAQAGGPGRQAKMRSVIIIRQDKGELVAARWDLKNIVKGDISRGDPLVMPFDIIYVPQSYISKLSEFLNTYVPTLLTPIDLTVRWFYYQELIKSSNK